MLVSTIILETDVGITPRVIVCCSVQLGWKCATVDAEGGGTLVSSSTVCPGLSDVKPTVGAMAKLSAGWQPSALALTGITESGDDIEVPTSVRPS